MRTLCIVAILLLSGCVSSQTLNDSDRAHISTVYISRNVAVPDKMTYLGPAGGAGLMFGALGALATTGSTMSDQDAIQLLAEKSNIHIDRILVQELAGALRASGKLPLADAPGSASDTIRIKIKEYGFSIPHGFSSNVVPTLFVQSEMVDQSGRVIWQGGGHLMPMGNPVDSFPAKTLNDPKVIAGAWRKASQAVAQSIVESLP